MILVAGEAVVDLVQRPLEDGRDVFEPIVGGSPLNVAVGLARLERPACFLTALSTDRLGTRIFETLHREGVDLRFARRSARPSSMVLATLDEAGVADYTFYVEGAADFALTQTDLPPDDARFACIHFGSLAAGLDPTAATLEAFVARRRHESVISFDPNIRPSVIRDHGAALARFERQMAHVDVLKASAEDVAWLYRSNDIAAVARAWSRLGPRLAVVTAGSEGAVAAIDGEVIAVSTPKVAVIDTIGAGDTFQAALLDGLAGAGYLSHDGLGQIDLARLRPLLERAAAAAAITCSRRGADLPRRTDLEAPSGRAVVG